MSRSSPESLLEVAADRAALAAILDAQRRHRQPQETLRHPLSMFESVLGPEHYEVAVTLDKLAAIAHRAGDSHLSAALYERALAIKRRVLGSDHSEVVATLSDLEAVRLSAARTRGGT